MSIYLKLFIALCWLLFCKQTIADNKPGKMDTVITQAGDTIVMSAIVSQKLHIANKQEYHQAGVDYTLPHPISLNGTKIFTQPDGYDEMEQLMHTASIKNACSDHDKLDELAEQAVSPLKDSLPEGRYVFRLRNLMVDEQGRVAYYQTVGLEHVVIEQKSFTKFSGTEEEERIAQRVINAFDTAVHKMVYTPLIWKDAPTPYISQYMYEFEVE